MAYTKEQNYFVELNERICDALSKALIPWLGCERQKGKYSRTDFTVPSYEYNGITYKYVGDYKSYTNPEHPRNYNLYPNYEVDYDKLREIKKAAKNSNRGGLLVVFFTDQLFIWDITNINWESRYEWKPVNKKGGNYGEKEEELMTWLYDSEAWYIQDIDRNYVQLIKEQVTEELNKEMLSSKQ